MYVTGHTTYHYFRTSFEVVFTTRFLYTTCFEALFRPVSMFYSQFRGPFYDQFQGSFTTSFEVRLDQFRNLKFIHGRFRSAFCVTMYLIITMTQDSLRNCPTVSLTRHVTSHARDVDMSEYSGHSTCNWSCFFRY